MYQKSLDRQYLSCFRAGYKRQLSYIRSRLMKMLKSKVMIEQAA